MVRKGDFEDLQMRVSKCERHILFCESEIEKLGKDVGTTREEEPSITESYFDLLMCVESKYPGETRHQTAKKYIRERENPIFLHKSSVKEVEPSPQQHELKVTYQTGDEVIKEVINREGWTGTIPEDAEIISATFKFRS